MIKLAENQTIQWVETVSRLCPVSSSTGSKRSRCMRLKSILTKVMEKLKWAYPIQNIPKMRLNFRKLSGPQDNLNERYIKRRGEEIRLKPFGIRRLMLQKLA